MIEVVEPENSQKVVLESKLRPPRLRKVLERPRLLQQTESSCAPRLINICAGPGFGKTTLMAQMAREFAGNSVWYQADGLDRDPAVFLRHLISGISHACGFEGTRARSRLGDVTDYSTESESVLAVLIDELGEHSQVPVMFCFDDYHLFDNGAHAPRCIEYMIQNLPEESCVVIAARSYPELTLGRLRTHGLLRDLKDEDLQFSLEELSSLTDVWEIEVSPTVLKKVQRSTEGWAAGLVLTENYLRSGNDLPDLFSHHRLQQHVYEYLAEEVLSNLPDEIQAILVQIALIDPIDPDICAKALENKEVCEILAEAEQGNLFTNRLDQAELYRYHPLFRDFLLSRLVIQAGKEGMNEMRAKFAEAFIAAGQERPAIEQYLAAGRQPEAIALIEQIGDGMLETAEYGTLENWIDSLNEKDTTPAIEIQRAMILMSAGKFRKALHIFKTVEPGLDNDKAELLLKLRFAAADCFNELGNCHKAIELLEKALELPLTDEMHQEVIYRMAGSYFINFDHKGLNACIDAAVKMKCDDDNSLTRGCKFILIMQHLRYGNFPEALRMQKKYMNYEKLSESQTNLYINNMASCLMMMGNYSEARFYAEQCLQRVEKQEELKTLPVVLDTLGCLIAAEGDYKRGEHLLMKAMQVGSQLEQKRGDTLAAIKCHLGTWARRQGKPNVALKYHHESLNEAICTNEIYEIAMSKVNIMTDFIHLSYFEEAEKIYLDARILVSKYNLRYVQTAMDFSLAWAAYLKGDVKEVEQYIMSALSMSREFQHNHWLIQEGNNSIELYKFALENGIEVDYVCWILERIGEKSLLAIEPVLNHNDPIVREKIASLLYSLGSMGALTLLRRMRYDSNERVKETVKEALATLRKKLISSAELLTTREVEVLECVSLGLTNNQIAQKLYISERTVKTHVAKIFRKLGFTNRIDAALYFKKRKEKNTTIHD